ncbi:helix-turn-helix domain-containing protein [Chengkuizengella sp. SCS-71B]|uniref:helix-turn-helix domain-containing protein n=1 Tax=Chengkuizengella sp. SCS-71B TaxID=3115290 RepID=UPI0032C232A7
MKKSKGENVMKLTDKLDELMKQKGISRMGLSKESGIPYSTLVNFYEKGTDNVKLSTLKKLSDYFKVSLDFLVYENVGKEDKLNETLEFYKKSVERKNSLISRINEKDSDTLQINEEIELRILEAERRLINEFIEDLILLKD